MEYINVNKLKQDIIDSWESNNHKGYAASRIHNQEHRDLMLIVGRQPTADVVPKAKYQQLQHKYNLAVAEREANVKGFTEETVDILNKLIEQLPLVCNAEQCRELTTRINYAVIKLRDRYHTEGR